MNKKILSAFVAGVAFCSLSSTAETFSYSSQLFLGLSTLDEGWTITNNTPKAKSWVADPGNCTNKSTSEQFAVVGEGITGGASHQYDSSTKANCWLFSPALKLEEGVEYTVTIWARTYFTPSDEHESFDVSVGNEATAKAQNTVIIHQPSYQNGGDFEKLTGTYTPEESGEYYFGIYCYSEADQYQLFVTGFSVTGETSGEGGEGGGGDEEDPTPGVATPAAVSDLSVAADGLDGLKVSVFWEYPSVSTTGEKLNEGGITKAELFRNGEVVYTDDAPGMFGSYADDEIPEAGVYTYKVRVYGADDSYDEANEIEVSAGYVGKPTIDLPIDIYNPTQDVAEKFTVQDADEDGSTWVYHDGGTWSREFVSTIADDKTTADNYLGTPYVHLPAGFYEVSFNVSGNDQTYELGLATNRHVMNETFVKFDNLSYNKGIFEVTEEKDYVLVVHHTGTSDPDNKTLKVSGITLERFVVTPGVVTELKAVGSIDNAVISWTNPSLDNLGYVLASIDKAVVYRDGVAIATITDTDETPLKPGQTSTYTDDSFDHGAKYKYSVEIYSGDAKSDQAAPSVSVFAGKGKDADIAKNSNFSEWELFHADGASGDWERNNGELNFYTNSIDGGEAYAATPFIYIEPGYDYTFTVEAYAKNADDATLEAYCGSDHHADALTKIGDMALENGSKKEFAFTVSSPREAETFAASASPLVVGNNTFAVKATASKKDVYISAYSLSARQSETTGIFTVAAGNAGLAYSHGVVTTPVEASRIAAYALNGACLAQVSNASELSLKGLTRGQTVVVVAVIDSKTYTLKISL